MNRFDVQYCVWRLIRNANFGDGGGGGGGGDSSSSDTGGGGATGAADTGTTGGDATAGQTGAAATGGTGFGEGFGTTGTGDVASGFTSGAGDAFGATTGPGAAAASSQAAATGFGGGGGSPGVAGFGDSASGLGDVGAGVTGEAATGSSFGQTQGDPSGLGTVGNDFSNFSSGLTTADLDALSAEFGPVAVTPAGIIATDFADLSTSTPSNPDFMNSPGPALDPGVVFGSPSEVPSINEAGGAFPGTGKGGGATVGPTAASGAGKGAGISADPSAAAGTGKGAATAGSFSGTGKGAGDATLAPAAPEDALSTGALGPTAPSPLAAALGPGGGSIGTGGGVGPSPVAVAPAADLGGTVLAAPVPITPPTNAVTATQPGATGIDAFLAQLTPQEQRLFSQIQQDNFNQWMQVFLNRGVQLQPGDPEFKQIVALSQQQAAADIQGQKQLAA